MASFVTVRNVNPIGAVTAYLDDEHVEVPAGGTIAVTPETAGRAPRWRRADIDPETGEPSEALDQLHVRARAGHLEVFDLGTGLLAQPSCWRAEGDGDPAEPTDAGGGHLIDVQASAGLPVLALLGEHGPEEFTPETSGVVTPNTGTENS